MYGMPNQSIHWWGGKSDVWLQLGYSLLITILNQQWRDSHSYHIIVQVVNWARQQKDLWNLIEWLYFRGCCRLPVMQSYLSSILKSSPLLLRGQQGHRSAIASLHSPAQLEAGGGAASERSERANTDNPWRKRVSQRRDRRKDGRKHRGNRKKKTY